MQNKHAVAFLLGLFLLAGCHSNPYRQGEDLFEAQCAGCHSSDGSGLANLIPPLDTSVLKLNDPIQLVCLIRNGLPFDSLTRQQMPANQALSDVEMTNLVNYLGVHYIANPQLVRVEEVTRMYTECQTRKPVK